MVHSKDITGVVLAGGRARRMGGKDKGLILFQGKPLVFYAIEALKSVAVKVVINANRCHDEYSRFGYPLISDATNSFDGPLAGILSALHAAETRYVLTVPCDTPFVTGLLLKRLCVSFHKDTELCVAYDGERVHPVFLLADCCLSTSLQAYLANGGRKIEPWIYHHKWAHADYKDSHQCFANINTLDELAVLENGYFGY